MAGYRKMFHVKHFRLYFASIEGSARAADIRMIAVQSSEMQKRIARRIHKYLWRTPCGLRPCRCARADENDHVRMLSCGARLRDREHVGYALRTSRNLIIHEDRWLEGINARRFDCGALAGIRVED